MASGTMMPADEMPVMREPYDIMRNGLPGAKAAVTHLGKHPVQLIQDNGPTDTLRAKHAMLANTYGIAMPAKMDIECQILSKCVPQPSAVQGPDLASPGPPTTKKLRSWFFHPRPSLAGHPQKSLTSAPSRRRFPSLSQAEEASRPSLVQARPRDHDWRRGQVRFRVVPRQARRAAGGAEGRPARHHGEQARAEQEAGVRTGV
mmetsp:Transcript_7516/g.30454  ORF Transcript_7516/g.30454 Transcript_7516/m.30454 type:complete len:203 (-) Transcript_7516:683-1291(-)